MDAKYDDAVGRLKDVEADLAAYLQQIRGQLGAGKDLSYVTVNKDVNLLEIPEVTTSEKHFCFTSFRACLFTQQAHCQLVW